MEANVLITAVGGIVGQGLIKCLKYSNKTGNSPVKYIILGADMSATAAGIYRSDAAAIIPSAQSADGEEEYLESVVNLCLRRDIKAIFVGSDIELVVLAKFRQRIESESGAKILIAPLNVIAIGRDKWKTYEFCKANRIPYVESALPDDHEGFVREFGFPLVVKPREGYGSVHYYLVNNNHELTGAISAIQAGGWHPMIQRYVGNNDGHYQVIGGSCEFTTGVTIDTTGEKVMSSVSINKVLKGGQTHKALVDDFPIVRESAESAALKLKATGSINIQAKLEDDSPRIFEINPRFSATCPMRAIAGVNEPDIIFRNTLNNEDLTIRTYRKLVCLRYLNEVYVPYSIYQGIESTRELDWHIESDTGKECSFIADYF